jgi:hypothetical protein
VTGSVLAMATNASASSIVYSNTPVTASILGSAGAGKASASGYATVLIGRGGGIGLDLQQSASALGSHGFARLGVASGFDAIGFLASAGPERDLQKLSSGQAINGAGIFRAEDVASVNKNQFGTHLHGWAAGGIGFAAFEFVSTVSDNRDYGWVRLEYTSGASGLPNSMTVLSWAYDDTGASIIAGDTGSAPSAPEPSTAAMALLAAGAAGVVALRRRRSL